MFVLTSPPKKEKMKKKKKSLFLTISSFGKKYLKNIIDRTPHAKNQKFTCPFSRSYKAHNKKYQNQTHFLSSLVNLQHYVVIVQHTVFYVH